MEGYYLGIDIGTGSCKAVVVDAAARPLGLGRADYGPAESFQEKWNEQDPAAILAAMFAAGQRALTAAAVTPAACRALSLSSALHSLIALDGRGHPLTGVITWADLRATPQAQAARAAPLGAALYAETGCPPHAMLPLYKIVWLREAQPQLFDRAARFVSIKEYALEALTGEWLVDFNIAAGSGLLNAVTLGWNPASLALAQISAAQLSPLCDPRTRISGLRPQAATRLGLAANTPVIVGSSDAVNSSLGAGATEAERQATCMVGTSGALRRISAAPVLDERGRTWCYAIDPTHYLVGGSINNGGLALTWLREVLTQAGGELSFAALLDLAAQVPPGADGVLCLPFFAGERSPNWNMDAKATFHGLTLGHDARHLARAVLEGVAYRLRSIYEVLQAQGAPQEMRASGGFTQSPLWLQTVADVLNCELRVPVWGETSCLGAALWALLGAEALASLEEMGALVPVGAVVAPDPAAAAVYARHYLRYQALLAAVAAAQEV